MPLSVMVGPGSRFYLTYPPGGGPAGLWSDPATWGGAVPAAGANVMIGAGMHVVQDMNPTPAYASVMLMDTGTLEIKSNSELITDSFQAMGDGWTLTGGNAGDYEPTRLTNAFITLTGAPTTPNNGISRGAMFMGKGWVRVRGFKPNKSWTKLNAHANPGDTTFTLRDVVDWQAGHEVVIGPTDFIAYGRTEKLSMSAPIVGHTMSTTAPLVNFRWGLMQYPIDAPPYFSLTPGTFTPPVNASPLFPTSLDQRAPVGNLTRGFEIRCPIDSYWTGQEYGCHVMFMAGVKFILDGWRVRRGGQQGTIGRYPIHAHYISWNSATGAFIGQAVAGEADVIDCVVMDSSQRGFVVHGTNGMRLINNIGYNIKGAGVFLEDAIEQFTTIDGNLILNVHPTTPARRLKVWEGLPGEEGGTGDQGVPCYWIPNAKQYFYNNHGCDSLGSGIWFAISHLGPAPGGIADHLGIPMQPNYAKILDIHNNTAHSCYGALMSFRGGEADVTGFIDIQYRYDPREDETVTGPPMLGLVQTINVFKGELGTYKNAFMHPHYEGWSLGDSFGNTHMGQITDNETPGIDGLIVRDSIDSQLIYGFSLNNANPTSPESPVNLVTSIKQGPISYHWGAEIKSNMFINFPEHIITVTSNIDRNQIGDWTNGWLGNNDFYVRPVERGGIQGPNNVFRNVGQWVRARSMNEPPFSGAGAQQMRAGAMWDPYRIFGDYGIPTIPNTFQATWPPITDAYNVFNTPFFTYGGDGTHNTATGDGIPCTGVIQAGWDNGRMISDQYVGMNIEQIDTHNYSDDPLSIAKTWQRLDASYNPVGGHDIWHIDSGNSGTIDKFHHAAMRNHGNFVVTFPGYGPPTQYVGGDLSCLFNSGIDVMIGISFNCSGSVFVYQSCNGPTGNPIYQPSPLVGRTLTQTSSRAAVKAGDGKLFWPDPVNNLVWIKWVGDLVPFEVAVGFVNPNPFAETVVYRHNTWAISSTALI